MESTFLSCKHITYQVIPTYPIVFILNQHLFQEVCWPLRQIIRNHQGFFHYVIVKVWLRSPIPWKLTCQKFVVNEPNRPDIALSGIFWFFQNLGRHVQWGSHNWEKQFAVKMINVFSEPKICQLELSFWVDQNVGWL